MIDCITAYEIAKNYYEMTYKVTASKTIAETEKYWIIGPKDGEAVPMGFPNLMINKATGNCDELHMPSAIGFSLLKDSNEVTIK